MTTKLSPRDQAKKLAENTPISTENLVIVTDSFLSINDKIKKLTIRGLGRTLIAGYLGQQFSRVKNIVNSMLSSGNLSKSNSEVFTDEDRELFTKWYEIEKANRPNRPISYRNK